MKKFENFAFFILLTEVKLGGELAGRGARDGLVLPQLRLDLLELRLLQDPLQGFALIEALGPSKS